MDTNRYIFGLCWFEFIRWRSQKFWNEWHPCSGNLIQCYRTSNFYHGLRIAFHMLQHISLSFWHSCKENCAAKRLDARLNARNGGFFEINFSDGFSLCSQIHSSDLLSFFRASGSELAGFWYCFWNIIKSIIVFQQIFGLLIRLLLKWPNCRWGSDTRSWGL